MDFLVTVIGNAAVDPVFRDELLTHPRTAVDRWGLRLTKGEVELLEAMFTKQQVELKKNFEALEYVLYENIKGVFIKPCPKPCYMSISRPAEVRKAHKKAA